MNGGSRLVVLGFLVGLVDIVPGMSGGTVILLAQQYVRFTEAMSAAPSHIARAVRRRSISPARTDDVSYLGVLGIGALGGWVLGATVIGAALVVARAATAAVFAGVITVGAILVLQRTTARRKALAGAAGGVGVGLGLSFASASLPTTPLVVFGASILASSATVLPGVSGAFLLYALGQYEYVLVDGVRALPSVATGHIEPLVIVSALALGGVLGAFGTSRLAKRLVDKHEDVAFGWFAGLMLGTVRVALIDALSGSLSLLVVGGLFVVGGGGLFVLWTAARQ